MTQLYQEVLLKHSRNPYGATPLPPGKEDGEALNTGCGDEIRVAMTWSEDHCLERMTYELHGCAVSMAAASMVAQRLEGKTPTEIATMRKAFTARIGQTGFEEEWGDFQVFNGIERYPARIHCAMLVWQAIDKALPPVSG